jgi:tRNA(fMet)-specific endonuclease VapC
MNRYLLDTNHLTDAIKPVSRVRDRIEQARRSGLKVGTCIPVVCELEAGLQRLARHNLYRQALERLFVRVRLWPLDRGVARHYGDVFNDLRNRGRVLSQVDILLAALCHSMDLILVTSDRDFEALPNLRREDWLNPN